MPVPVLRTIVTTAASVVLAAMVAVSCSAGSNEDRTGPWTGKGGDNNDGGGASSGSDGAGSSTAPDGSSGGEGGGGSGGTDAAAGSGGSEAGQPDDGGNYEPWDETCAGESYPGSMPPLDVYILLDATGSMTGDDKSPNVWEPVKNAIKAVLNDPKSEKIGVGLTYLPVPVTDTSLQLGRCGGAFGACAPGKGSCVRPAGMFMANTGCDQQCTVATEAVDCGIYGHCFIYPLQMNKRWCMGSLFNDSCDPADYGHPVVAIAELPGNASAVSNSIDGKTPNGESTPSRPALEGTHRYAREWTSAHPNHIVNVLFATDGEPNTCTSGKIDDVADVAKKAYDNYPYIPTFVLGIGDVKNLDVIAKAGGTSKAYMADAATVASQLLDVFNEIRANGECQFLIPQPEPGTGLVLDYNQINVRYTPLGETEPVTVVYVEYPEHCDPVNGGWYYDDPTKANPTRVLLCPATCDAAKLLPEDKGVDVELGCTTRIY